MTTNDTEVAKMDALIMALSDAAYDCGGWFLRMQAMAWDDDEGYAEAYSDVVGRRDAAKTALTNAIATALHEREVAVWQRVIRMAKSKGSSHLALDDLIDDFETAAPQPVSEKET